MSPDCLKKKISATTQSHVIHWPWYIPNETSLCDTRITNGGLEIMNGGVEDEWYGGDTANIFCEQDRYAVKQKHNKSLHQLTFTSA